MKCNNVESETKQRGVVFPGGAKCLNAMCVLPKGLPDAVGLWQKAKIVHVSTFLSSQAAGCAQLPAVACQSWGLRPLL